MKVSDLRLDDAAKIAFGHLLKAVSDKELPKPTGWHVLVLQWIRPSVIVLPSGVEIHQPESTQKEDEWQGRTGLVLDVGPEAWADRTRYPEGAWAYPGDTVMWGKSEGSRFAFGEYASGKKVVLTLLQDDRILAKGIDPLKAGQ